MFAPRAPLACVTLNNRSGKKDRTAESGRGGHSLEISSRPLGIARAISCPVTDCRSAAAFAYSGLCTAAPGLCSRRER